MPADQPNVERSRPIAKGAPIDNLFILGNGINGTTGWAPIHRALVSFSVTIKTQPPTSDTDYAFLANWVNLRRQMGLFARHTRKQKRARWLPGILSNQDLKASRARDLGHAAGVSSADGEMKKLIASELIRAVDNGGLQLSAEALAVIGQYQGSCAFLTTNWDLALENHFRTVLKVEPRVEHLHGDVTHPEELLLPSEVSEEAYRPETLNLRMAGRKKRLIDFIEPARNIVVCGLSFSPLDAELSMVLAGGLFDSQFDGKIFVHDFGADPCCLDTPAPVSGVAARVRLCCPTHSSRSSSHWEVVERPIPVPRRPCGTPPSSEAR